MGDWALPSNYETNWRSPLIPKRHDSSFLDSWAAHAALWGTRHGVGESLDRYFGLHSPELASDLLNQVAELGIDDFEGKHSGLLGYGNILKLRTDYVSKKDLSWKNVKNQVKENTEPLRNHLKSTSIKDFFQDINGKDYAKQLLWESNARPFKGLLSGSTDNLFKNLFYTAGVGLVGASIIQTGVQHYRYWHQKEEGSIASQWRTAYHTGKAVSQKAIQSFGSWEAAGLGMAIGQALIPIGAFPIGGILIGSMFATTAYKAIGKLFPSLAKPASSKS